MKKQQPIARIVEKEQSNIADAQVFDEIYNFLKRRQQKVAQFQTLTLAFDIERKKQEKFWLTDVVLNPDMNKLKVSKFENTFEIFPKHCNPQKNEQKTFCQDDFDELLRSIFVERGVYNYKAPSQDNLFEYAKTAVTTEKGKTLYPKIKFTFFKEDEKSIPKAFVSIFEGKKEVAKNIEFRHVDSICKNLNNKKLEQEF